MSVAELRPNMDHWQERVDMAASFRWVERLNMHEGVANHFSLAVNAEGSQFLMNANQMHFARITASNLLLLDSNDPETMTKPGVPDPTACGAAWLDPSPLSAGALRDACAFDFCHGSGLFGRQQPAAD